MNLLLNMTGCKNKEELNATVPINTTMANAEKAARLGLFQTAVDALLDMCDIEGFSVMITMTMFNNMLLRKWDTVTVDSTNTG